MFYYPYRLIRKTNFLYGIPIASVEDIAAMKIIAVVQRGSYRDFIDVYYLIKNFELENILVWVKEKYQEYPLVLILKELIYFEDADKTAEMDMLRIQTSEKVNWEDVKRFIKCEVEAYSKRWIVGKQMQ